MSDVERFRVGRKLGRTVYRQLGDDPDGTDELIGMMDTREWGQRVVEALNEQAHYRERHEGA